MVTRVGMFHLMQRDALLAVLGLAPDGKVAIQLGRDAGRELIAPAYDGEGGLGVARRRGGQALGCFDNGAAEVNGAVGGRSLLDQGRADKQCQ